MNMSVVENVDQIVWRNLWRIGEGSEADLSYANITNIDRARYLRPVAGSHGGASGYNVGQGAPRRVS
jgi:hypothetical protein